MKGPHMQRSLDRMRGKSSVSCDGAMPSDQMLPPVIPPEAEQLLTVASYPQHIHSLKNENLGG